MYRDASPPEPEPKSFDYEQELVRSAKRKRLVFGVVVGLTTAIGAGMVVWSLAITRGTNAWNAQRVNLTVEEAKEANGLLDTFEATIQRNQSAFEAAWPKLRAGEIHPHPELGDCWLHRMEDARMDWRSLPADGSPLWTFVDLTPGDALRDSKVRLAPADKPPQLVATSKLERLASFRAEMAEGVRRDSHARFLEDVAIFAASEGGLKNEVIVFVDELRVPDFIAGRAFAWQPNGTVVACAAHAFAKGSTPQNLPINLERFLLVSFDPAAEGKPKVIQASPDQP